MPAPALDPRRARERAVLTRLMVAHETALERRLVSVISAGGQHAARMHREHGRVGLVEAMRSLEAKLGQVLRPSLTATAREFGERVTVEWHKAFDVENPKIGRFTYPDRDEVLLDRKAFEDLDAGIAHAIAEHVATRVTQVTDSMRQAIAEVVRRGVAEGWSEDELAGAIQDALGNEMAAWRARRIARTETHTAAGMGQYEAAQASPLRFMKRWLATEDHRTRRDHAEADEKNGLVPLDRPFRLGLDNVPMLYPGDPSAPANQVINCFPAGTLVSGAVRSATRHRYDGDLIEITTAGGRKLAGTPNHPVLTPEGWIPLRLLKKGSYVVSCGISGVCDASIRTDAEDVGDVETCIEQVFDTLAVLGREMRVAGLTVDFHGDRPTENVDIVRADGVLRAGRNVAGLEELAKHALSIPDLAQGLLLRSRLALELESACRSATPGLVGSQSEKPAFLGRRPLHADDHRLAAVTHLDAGLLEAPANSTPCDLKARRQLFDRHPGVVELDEVIGVNVRAHRGHVFNLETAHGFYEASGIVVHNCRCTVLYEPVEVLPTAEVVEDLPTREELFATIREAMRTPHEMTLYTLGPNLGLPEFAKPAELEDLVGDLLPEQTVTGWLDPRNVGGAGLQNTFPGFGRPVVVQITVPEGARVLMSSVSSTEITAGSLSVRIVEVRPDKWGTIQDAAGVEIDKPRNRRRFRRMPPNRGVTLVVAEASAA